MIVKFLKAQQDLIKATVNKKNTYEIEMLLSDIIEGKVNGNDFKLDLIETGDDSFHVLKNNQSFNIDLLGYDKDEKVYKIAVNGNSYNIELEDEYDRLLKEMGLENLAAAKQKELKAPMPGMVLSVMVKPGQEVEKNEPLLILEAMKMENVIKAQDEGVVKSVKVEEGKSVEKNAVLVEFE